MEGWGQNSPMMVTMHAVDHLDDMATPRHLPAHSAVGAGNAALPHCCHPMVCAVLVVGS